jgi:hypothetical protein
MNFRSTSLFSLNGLLFSAMMVGVVMPPRVLAQQITQAQIDSGWVSAFDGKTLNGFYSIIGSGAPNNDLVKNPDGVFAVRTSDSCIHTEGSPTAHIITKKLYSHYRVRIREKFDKLGETNQNAGMLYHARIEGPRMGAYPRSIEYQGQKRGMGEIWTISNVWVNTTVDSTMTQHKFKLNGKMVNHGNANGRQCLGSSVPYIDGAWNVMEGYIRGSDSAVHYVNGVVVFKCWKMRWSDKDDPNDMTNMMKEGSIALQAEGAPVSYRDYMFMELDPVTGKAVNGKPTLAEAFTMPSKGNLLRAEARQGGWIIRYSFPTSARLSGDAGQLSIRSLSGRLITTLSLPGPSGEVYWQGMGANSRGPLLMILN